MKSICAAWLNFSPTSWVFDIFLAFLCGVGLFLLLLPCLQSHPPLPLSRKHRNIRKCQTEPWGKKRNKKKIGNVEGPSAIFSEASVVEPTPQEIKPSWEGDKHLSDSMLRTYRTCLRQLEGARSLLSLLQSNLVKSQNKSSFHQLLPQDSPDEVCKGVSAGAQWPCEKHVDHNTPAMSPSTPPAPLTGHSLPLASTFSPGPIASSVSGSSYVSLSGSQPPESLPTLEDSSPPPLSPPPLHPSVSGVHPPLPLASSTPPLTNSVRLLPQCDSLAVSLNAATQRSSPNPPWSASPLPAISGLGHSSCPKPGFSWLQAAAKSLCVSTSPHSESQQEHLSHPPPGTSLWGDPINRQTEVDSLSLLNSNDRELLGIQVTKRVEIKIWNENEDGSYSRQISPDYHLNPLGHMLKSLSSEQDVITPHLFWNTKGKSGHLPRPQQLSYPNVLGNHLEQKYNQLFWGLPSLHSESLVATAWISESSSALQSPTFLFNGFAHTCPVQIQAKISSLLSQSPPPSHLECQSQPLVPTKSQLQSPTFTQVQTQDHLQPSVPILQPSSPPHTSACGISYSTSQSMSQSLSPTEIQHPEWPMLQKQLESGWTLSSVVKCSQEVFNVFSPSPSVDNWVVSIVPDNFPISPELRKQLERHLQSWLIQHRWELPQRIQESLELKQLRGQLPRTCQAKVTQRFSHPYVFTGESSKSTQKAGFPLRRDMRRSLGDILGKVPKDLSRCSENSLVKVWGVNSDESEIDLGMSSSNSGSDLLNRLDKNLDHILKIHLSRKLGRITEHLIPLTMHHSSPAVHQGHMKKENLDILKGGYHPVNTSHRLPFLDAHTQELLEAHIVKVWVKHKWRLPLKVLKPINLFKMIKAWPSPFLQFNISPSATTVHRGQSRVRFAKVQGESSQAQESVPILEKTVLASSPTCEEIQGHKQPSPSVTNRQSSHMEWNKRGRTESSPTSATGRNESGEESHSSWTSQDACHEVKTQVNLGSQMKAKENENVVEAKDSLDLQPQSRAVWDHSMMSTSQTENVPVRTFESLGSIKNPLLSQMPVFQDPGEPCLTKEVVSELKAKVEAKSKNQPQDYPTHELVVADNMISWVPKSYNQMTAGDRLASPVCSDFVTDQKEGDRGQQEPGILKFQDSWKRQNKMTDNMYVREDYRKFNPREYSGFENWQTSQVGYKSCPAPVGETGKNQGSKYLKKQAPSESIFRKKLRLFFQWIFSNKKGKDQDLLLKDKYTVATSHNHGSDKRRCTVNGETAEAQALMTAVGQILEEKMALNHGCQGTKLDGQGQEVQCSVCRCFHYHRPAFHSAQRRMSNTTCSHQGTSKSRGYSTRESQIRHRHSLKSVRFNDEQLGLKRSPTLSPKKTLSPIGPYKFQSGMPILSSHHCHHHCPRHCFLQSNIFPGKS